MPDYSAADGSGADDDEELGQIDQRGKESALRDHVSCNFKYIRVDRSFTHQKDHCPFVSRNDTEYRELVCPWDDI